MTLPDKINIERLQQNAKDSANSESYQPLDKTKDYRVGVGARAIPPSPSFFVEIIVNLSDESKHVDLSRLQKALGFLAKLEARGYTLYYESDNCISCELKTDSTNLNQEYALIRTLIKKALI
jgi:hypothetical protein